MPLCRSKIIHSPLQGFLSSDPDLEMLLNKISTVNHLLSSLEKKVPDPSCGAGGRHSYPFPKLTSLSNQATVAAHPRLPAGPVSPAHCSFLWQVLKSLQETVTRHNLALPSVAVAPLPAARPLAVQNFEVSLGTWRDFGVTAGQGSSVGTAPEPLCVQVKVGKSQRAALMVDVESGTVTVTKRGSGSSEEVIPQDKSKALLHSCRLPMGFFGAVVFPAIA